MYCVCNAPLGVVKAQFPIRYRSCFVLESNTLNARISVQSSRIFIFMAFSEFCL